MGFQFTSQKLVSVDNMTQAYKKAIKKREKEGYQLVCIEEFSLKYGGYRYEAHLVDLKRNAYRYLVTHSNSDEIIDDHEYISNWDNLEKMYKYYAEFNARHTKWGENMKKLGFI